MADAAQPKSTWFTPWRWKWWVWCLLGVTGLLVYQASLPFALNLSFAPYISDDLKTVIFAIYKPALWLASNNKIAHAFYVWECSTFIWPATVIEIKSPA